MLNYLYLSIAIFFCTAAYAQPSPEPEAETIHEVISSLSNPTLIRAQKEWEAKNYESALIGFTRAFDSHEIHDLIERSWIRNSKEKSAIPLRLAILEEITEAYRNLKSIPDEAKTIIAQHTGETWEHLVPYLGSLQPGLRPFSWRDFRAVA